MPAVLFFSLQNPGICPAPRGKFSGKIPTKSSCAPKTLFILLLPRLYLVGNQSARTTTALLGHSEGKITVLKPCSPRQIPGPRLAGVAMTGASQDCTAFIQFPADIWCKNDVVLTSMRRDHVASTLIQRHFDTKCPLGNT